MSIEQQIVYIDLRGVKRSLLPATLKKQLDSHPETRSFLVRYKGKKIWKDILNLCCDGPQYSLDCEYHEKCDDGSEVIAIYNHKNSRLYPFRVTHWEERRRRHSKTA